MLFKLLRLLSSSSSGSGGSSGWSRCQFRMVKGNGVGFQEVLSIHLPSVHAVVLVVAALTGCRYWIRTSLSIGIENCPWSWSSLVLGVGMLLLFDRRSFVRPGTYTRRSRPHDRVADSAGRASGRRTTARQPEVRRAIAVSAQGSLVVFTNAVLRTAYYSGRRGRGRETP